MVNKEDKRLLLKVAYGYFQEGRYDRALDEYLSLIRMDATDFNLHLMVADIQARRNNQGDAIKEYLITATLQRQQGHVDKELATCRKILKLDSSHAQALTRFREALELKLNEARQLIGAGQLEEAEALCRKLLEMDESQLAVHKVLDAIAEQRIMRQAEVQAAPASVSEAADPTEEVIRKLHALADSYLAAEDFENAMESFRTILTFDPENTDIRDRLAEIELTVEKKKQANSVWTNMQSEETRRMEEVKRIQMEEEARERWEREEAEARARMEAELKAVEATAEKEKAILEKAVAEFKRNLALQEAAQEKGDAAVPQVAEPQKKLEEMERQTLQQTRQLKEKFEQEATEREGRLRSETEALKNQLQSERQESEEKSRQREQQQKAETELLKQQMELDRLEAEARAREAAAQELGQRLEQERRLFEERMALQQKEMVKREEAFRLQMEELMRRQTEKLEKEVREKSLADLKYQMEQQALARNKVEAESKVKEEAALDALKAQQDAQLQAQAVAVEKARSQRQALEKLQQDEEERRLAIFQAAQQKGEIRLDGTKEEKAEVKKASRRISDAMRAASTKHMEQNLSAMIQTAHSYVRQDLLTDAMRLCQKIVEADPKNEEAKAILKEIFVKKGL